MGQDIDDQGNIEPALRYLVYVRVASLNDCPLWLDLNAFRGMQAALKQTQIENIANYETDNHFNARERLALAYADRITLSGQDVDEPFFAELLAEFKTPAAIIEFTSNVAFENFRSKFNHALLVESNGVCLLQNAGQQG